jgi:hypothetical protein
LTLLSMAMFPALGRVRTLYRALGDNNSLCEKRRYLNLGYWDDGEQTLDGAAERLAVLVGRAFWQIPCENLVPRITYADQLRATGFAGVAVDSIWHRVYPRFADYARRRLHAPDVVARLSPVLRRMLLASLGARRKLDPEAMDYVLASALKPATW